MQAAVGDGTSDQWEKANVVTETDAQPGDLVFQKGPEAGSDNHVGILCGKTDAGDWIAVHCSSSKNGVTVGEAYSASFRYIRQPSFYPTEAQHAGNAEQQHSHQHQAVIFLHADVTGKQYAAECIKRQRSDRRLHRQQSDLSTGRLFQ